jgi:hypothetical protein
LIESPKEYYEHSPAYYDLQGYPHATYEVYKNCSEKDMMVLQHVYKLLEERSPSCIVYPRTVNIPYHLQFIQMIPDGLLLAGSAAQYVLMKRDIPIKSDVDFFVFGKTFEDRRQTVEYFLNLLYCMAPNLRVVMYPSVLTVLIPGASNAIQVIYTDTATPEGILSRFDINAAKCGYKNHHWVVCLSAYLAHKTGTIVSDAKAHRLAKWKNKGYQIVSSVDYQHARDVKEFQYFHIPSVEHDPQYTNHLLKCLYHVNRVDYTYEEIIHMFPYKALNSNIYEINVVDNLNMDPQHMVNELSANAIGNVRYITTTFEVETGLMMIKFMGSPNYRMITISEHSMTPELKEFVAKVDNAMSRKFSSSYIQVKSVVKNMMKLHMKSTSTYFDVHGNKITDVLHLAPFSCTMRIHPYTICNENQVGELVWACSFMRSIDPDSVRHYRTIVHV